MGQRQVQKYSLLPDGQVHRVLVVDGAGVVGERQPQALSGHSHPHGGGDVGIVGDYPDPGLFKFPAADTAQDSVVVA